MNVRIGVSGRVVNSSRSSHIVRVEDDRSNSGGFLVFERWSGSTGPNAHEEFDSWVEDEARLDRFFEEAKWVIEWPAELDG